MKWRGMNWRRLAFGVFALCVGVAVGWLGQTLVHNNADATNVIVTVFSILAGFLIAVFAILGDPVGLSTGNWMVADAHRTEIERRLIRKQLLFLLYLITLGLVFAAVLLKDSVPGAMVMWIERIYLACAVAGFILSLGLPSSLLQLHRDRLDGAVEERRKRDIKDKVNSTPTMDPALKPASNDETESDDQ